MCATYLLLHNNIQSIRLGGQAIRPLNLLLILLSSPAWHLGHKRHTTNLKNTTTMCALHSSLANQQFQQVTDIDTATRKRRSTLSEYLS